VDTHTKPAGTTSPVITSTCGTSTYVGWMTGGMTLLHDHLDGGVRPSTLLELADAVGYRLPTSEPDSLAGWFIEAASSGSLTAYLQTFEHVCAVTQTTDALYRIAFEAVEDVAADGVSLAEFRFAPTQHVTSLSIDEVIEAVLGGLSDAASQAGVRVGLILGAVRPAYDSDQVAAAAVHWRDRGVVGFDLCAAEVGHPHDEHLEACRTVIAGDIPITIHAGEDLGPDSVALALDCGASRIGHGIAVVENCRWDRDQLLELGPVAQRVHEQQIPLEVCVTSNLQTKEWELEDHPVGRLIRAGFNVTLNTDNRLQSNTTLSKEVELVRKGFVLTDSEMAQLQASATNAAFGVA
jgi:adenosine deaminase